MGKLESDDRDAVWKINKKRLTDCRSSYQCLCASCKGPVSPSERGNEKQARVGAGQWPQFVYLTWGGRSFWLQPTRRYELYWIVQYHIDCIHLGHCEAQMGKLKK